MDAEKDNLSDEIKCLLSITRHRENLSNNLNRLADALRERARRHDQSKLQIDEFSGYVDLNRIARLHPLGSEEYKREFSKTDTSCLGLHVQRNSHHAEHYENREDMSFLDVIEMVFDWKAASDTYGNTDFKQSSQIQRQRYGLTDSQLWLVDQVLEFIDIQESSR